MKDSGEALPQESSVPRYWLIAKHENSQLRMLTVAPGGEEALPVFSFEEEAKIFLSLGIPGTGWRIRETTSGELISVLYGPCSSVIKVALDPPSIDSEVLIDLLCLNRKKFVCSLVNEHKLPVSHQRDSPRIGVA